VHCGGTLLIKKPRPKSGFLFWFNSSIAQ
jgi:hypothetical protein